MFLVINIVVYIFFINLLRLFVWGKQYSQKVGTSGGTVPMTVKSSALEYLSSINGLYINLHINLYI